MKIVVGLGNPGKEYAGTRHNVGFDVLRELSRRWNGAAPKKRFQAELVEILCGQEKLLLVSPQTYMNLSGQSVSQIVGFYQLPLEDLLVVCDDMNLPLGKLRMRGQGSSGGQKGLKNIIDSLSSEAVSRLRLGIGRPPGRGDSVNHVLNRFRSEETESYQLSLQLAADGVEIWAREGLAAAMNRINGIDPNEGSEQESKSTG
jgi:PTH1 family peptidyl-tRNA hydrolase